MTLPEGSGAPGRLLVALDAGVGVDPASFAAAWDGDEEALAVGGASKLEPVPSGTFMPGVLLLVVIPIAVNLASTALTALVSRLAERAKRQSVPREPFEVVEMETAAGDRIIVVRPVSAP
jgi:hypothetical protein